MNTTVLIPTWNEEGNIGRLIKSIKELDASYEVIAIDNASTDNTKKEVEQNGGKYVLQEGKGYGAALRTGFRHALAQNADVIVTMDGDLSHPPEIIPQIIAKISDAEVAVASRYCAGGGYAETKGLQRILSYALNWALAFRFRIPIKDFSSGFRAYHGAVIRAISPERDGYDILEEILVLAHKKKFTITEVPFIYGKRNAGKSKTQLFKLAPKYLSLLIKGR